MKFSTTNMKNLFLFFTLTSSIIALSPIRVFAINSMSIRNIDESTYNIKSSASDLDDFNSNQKELIRSRIRRVPCNPSSINLPPTNNIGVGLTSSMLIAIEPQPLPQCPPIRVPKA
jgi:hypothetical protein